MRTFVINGYVLDGMGHEGPATVIIEGKRICEVMWGSHVAPSADARILDVSGLVVAPGLIDMHSHDDVAAMDPEIYEAKIRQGVTTTLIGLDGLGYAPVDPVQAPSLIRYWNPVNGDPGSLFAPDLATYRESLTGRLGLNVALGVPHGNLRIRHQGWGLEPVSAEALAGMVKDAEMELEGGAYGLTTGLGYVPAMGADRRELQAMTTPLIKRQAIYASHLRSYGTEIFSAIDETIDLARRHGIAVHISHLHLSHPSLFGRAEEILRAFEQYRREGIRLTFDLYPYSAGSSILHSYLPSWLLDGGPDVALARLSDNSTLERLRRDPLVASYAWDRVVIGRTRTGRWIGMSIAESAHRQGTDPAAFMAQLLREESLEVGCIVHQTLEADDVLLAEDPGAVVGSDGIAYGQQPHPRYYGAFAAFYDRHVRQRKTLSMAAAMAKMSTQTADILGLKDRGRLSPGQAADLVIFDRERYRACATYEAPKQFADGVSYVFINGTLVWSPGHFDATARAGDVLTLG